jgi:hypothetical protein
MTLLRWSPFCLVVFSAIGLFGRGAQASVYVVDQAAPGASDTNAGTEESPFKTVQRAADAVQPGDTVYVMQGRYEERVSVKTSGAEGKPITFQAMPRRWARVWGFDLKASHIRVVGFEICAPEADVAVEVDGSYCEVLDNYIHEMMQAIGTHGEYAAVAHNRVAYNKVYHSDYGFVIQGNDWLVENNEVDRLFMYLPGRWYDDCDYSRFWGDGLVERYNYYHGTRQDEINTAHVDIIQTWLGGGGCSKNVLLEYNAFFDFHQGCMVTSDSQIGDVRYWTLRHNLYSTNWAPQYLRGGWGPDIVQALDVTIENCTIYSVNWSCIGLRGRESTNGQIRNNILCDAERAVLDGDETYTHSNPVIEYNLTNHTRALDGATNINGKDPLFVDPDCRNFRLRKGSAAIGAGKGGVTVGAMEWPNVYYVDPRHPGASDHPAWGYPGVPLATLSQACQIAQPGETIVLRGGVYREVLRPACDGVTIKAMEGEKVTISGANVVTNWMRDEGGGWSTYALRAPRILLRDGQPWTDFTYVKTGNAGRIVLKTGGDPRLHLFETVVRRSGINLEGRKDVKVEGITVVDALPAQ